MDLDLSGRRALVTGASRGIGSAVAGLLAAHGARVAVHYRADEAAAERTRCGLGGEGHARVRADLTDPDAAFALADAAAEALGGLDILVNNAGIYEHHPPAVTGADAWRDVWRRTIDLNLVAPAHLMHGAIGHLRAAGGGHVVNVSSRGAFRGEPDAPAYAASKAGLNALSQSLAVALAPERIYVTVVAPGWVETDMTAGYLARPEGAAIRAQSPLDRVAAPAEIARVVLFLVSGRADWLTGTIVDANGASYLRT